MDLPWAEKYRPETLDNVVGNEEIISRLKIIAKEGNIPNMILAGPSGIGKTTCILCLCRHLLGDDYDEAVLELNASDDRGIEAIRGQIKSFSAKKVNLKERRHKIIVLDEADNMTTGAQQALRRIVEIYSETTRFIFSCNYSNKIMEPIQSRCAILRFSPLKEEHIKECLSKICSEENVNVTESGIKAILFCAQGDLRSAINTLHSTFLGFGLVDESNVYKLTDTPSPHTLRRLIKSCINTDINEALKDLLTLKKRGYSSSDIVGTIFRVSKTMDIENKKLHLDIIREIGYTQMNVVDGLSSPLQLSGMVSRLCLLNINKDKFVIKE